MRGTARCGAVQSLLVLGIVFHAVVWGTASLHVDVGVDFGVVDGVVVEIEWLAAVVAVAAAAGHATPDSSAPIASAVQCHPIQDRQYCDPL